ncbi:NAD-dependent epimerase/dehydratase family protein [Rossellomorea marisflavi]|uniref:NAD-dependent epimerase/dehydratase family protein n=1 Tax=Rossellomorea marisflavi TaxID=189381 RepID=UPI00207AD8AC|nr:NAD-dependent epimerase/dehydratase family protein [Rossellomorea marisflavi]USK94169.1 GDP-mannose 4,6-dehydratase [Rossellomorea marisflavi]
MKKAIVTGGAGFIGSHLADSLIKDGLDVHIIDDLSSGKLEHLPDAASFHQLDISSQETRELITSIKPDVIYHLAAQADVNRSLDDPHTDMLVNVGGTINILEACRSLSLKKFVFSSTSAVYGNSPESVLTEDLPVSPLSYYGLSKLVAERYITLYHDLFSIPYTILRYGNVYGPRQTAKGEGGVIAVFTEKLSKGEPLKVNGDGLQTRDYVYVQDIVSANRAAGDIQDVGTFVVGTGIPTSLLEIIKTLENHTGQSIPYTHGADRPGDIKHSCLDPALINRTLGWAHRYDMDMGISETLRRR